MEKTNVMRVLDSKKIPYKSYHIDTEEALSGTEAARKLGVNEDSVYKTLVCDSKSGEHYVFVIPVQKELDLKKAASVCKEKSISMLKAKELLPLTGYVHGGCSPIGMKKYFKTILDISAKDADTIYFSAGKIGYHVELSPADLEKVIKLSYADLTSGI